MFGTETVTRGLTLGKVLSGINKTLSIANQVIPIYQQAKPMIQNAKSMMQVLKEFTSTKPSEVQKSTPLSRSTKKVSPSSPSSINKPVFFL